MNIKRTRTLTILPIVILTGTIFGVADAAITKQYDTTFNLTVKEVISYNIIESNDHDIHLIKIDVINSEERYIHIERGQFKTSEKLHVFSNGCVSVIGGTVESNDNKYQILEACFIVPKNSEITHVYFRGGPLWYECDTDIHFGCFPELILPGREPDRSVEMRYAIDNYNIDSQTMCTIYETADEPVISIDITSAIYEPKYGTLIISFDQPITLIDEYKENVILVGAYENGTTVQAPVGAYARNHNPTDNTSIVWLSVTWDLEKQLETIQTLDLILNSETLVTVEDMLNTDIITSKVVILD